MAGISGTMGMRSRRRGRGRARNRRTNQQIRLQLTSLMDILMIVVVFLLKSYGISSMNIVQADKMQLPISQAPELAGEGLVLVVAQDKITLDSEEVLAFKGDYKEKQFILPDGVIDASNRGLGIIPLYEKLKKKKEDFDLLASRSADPKKAAEKWSGDILVQADKAANYELIRQVMYTAGLAGYKQFRLTVEKHESD